MLHVGKAGLDGLQAAGGVVLWQPQDLIDAWIVPSRFCQLHRRRLAGPSVGHDFGETHVKLAVAQSNGNLADHVQGSWKLNRKP